MIKFWVQKLNLIYLSFFLRNINENDLSAFYFNMKKQKQNENPLKKTQKRNKHLLWSAFVRSYHFVS